jgi:signal transduction histidine kinase
MKKLTLTLFLALIVSVGFAQETKIDSLKLGLEKAKTDSAPYNTCISDNGPGIPSSIKDKIFQPFFTTKKGTEGTGLGLSLSYDIVKAHGGEIKVQTKENEGTEFTIQLPLT